MENQNFDLETRVREIIR